VVYYVALASDDPAVLGRAAGAAALRSAVFAPDDRTLRDLQREYSVAVAELRRHQEYLPKLEDEYRTLEAAFRGAESARLQAVEALSAAKTRAEAAEARLARLRSHPVVRAALAARRLFAPGRTAGKGDPA
jgi:septal ring factor EnvC (AmiA/AmiB activator)